MHTRQFCTPHLVTPQGATPLERVPLGDRTHSEKWFQELLYANPSLIPIDEIEEVFGPLIPLARELPTSPGRVDVAYISPSGYITLVETKLFRNPEARRQVVAQIVSYAAAMSQWTYADLCDAVRLARRIQGTKAGIKQSSEASDADPILSLVRDEVDFDEARFIDAVTKNIAQGRFLLLVAGDGIQHGVEQLADTLSSAPALGFSFALMEMAVFKAGEAKGSYFVQPRVLARTREIVRAVVEVRPPATPADVRVTVPTREDVVPIRLTERAFYEEVERNAGKGAADFARWFVAKVGEAPAMRFTWSKHGPALWWDHEESDSQAQFLRLRASGEISGTHFLQSYCTRHGLPRAIADAFQDEIVGLLSDARRIEKGNQGFTQLLDSAGNFAKFASLNARRDDVWVLISRTTAALEEAMASKR